MPVPTPENFNDWSDGRLPGLLGVETIQAEPGRLVARLTIEPHHMAPNGFLHAGTVISLADTACGYGCVTSYAEEATGFTTIELKANFTGTALEGDLICEATMLHGGRTTQVWDGTVRSEETGKDVAHIRVTQLILYGRGPTFGE